MSQSRLQSSKNISPARAEQPDFFDEPTLEERVASLERRFGLVVDLVTRLEDRLSRFFPAPPVRS